MYQGALRDWILSWKYHRRRAWTCPFGEFLAELVRSTDLGTGIEVVTAVPLHPRRRRARGFDQAQWLGRDLASRLGLPFRGLGLKRVVETPTQVGSGRELRRRTVEDAFRVRRFPWRPLGLRGRRVLLVDDVLTTGATADACSRTLLENGAREVRVATIATKS